MTTPDPSVPGGARVVVWDEHGVKALSSHSDPHSALAHMVSAGYTEPAPGSYAEYSQSPDWDWLDQWAKAASSGDDTALDSFYRERPHPAARAERLNDTANGTERHGRQLDEAIGDEQSLEDTDDEATRDMDVESPVAADRD